MADVVLTKDAKYKSQTTEPIAVMSGTDTVEVLFADDYSTLGLKVTDAGGGVTIYEVAIAERS